VVYYVLLVEGGMAVSRDDFVRFWTATHPNTAFTCRDCGSGALLINVNTMETQSPTADPADLRIPFFNNPDPNTLSYHSYIAVSCERCGHTYYYHQAIINNWLARNPTQGGLS